MASSQISLNLGIDFGTKYTKVCVRDTDRDESWIVILGQVNYYSESELHPENAFIVSQVGIRQNGTLVAGLTESEWLQEETSCSMVIDFLKMRLANLNPEQHHQYWYSPKLSNFQDNNLSSSNAIENLSAFFLYQVIQRSKAWIYQNDPDRFQNVEVDWSIQIGVPVEYADSLALERFRQVLCLAWHFCEVDINDISFNELNDYLDDIRQSLETNTIPCFGIPEIAAAVYSYTSSRQAKQGTYIFFDIGGGTIEGAAFKFYRDDNDDLNIDFLVGSVKPKGVNALAKEIVHNSEKYRHRSVQKYEYKFAQEIVTHGEYILSEIEKISKQYKNSCSSKGDFIANKHQVSTEVVRKQLTRSGNLHLRKILILILCQYSIHRQVAEVIKNCKKKLLRGDKPITSVFLGGGGKLSAYYQDTINATYDAFSLSSTDIPRYNMLDIPYPTDLNMKGISQEHFHRFAIAYGLSIPDYQVPELRLPREFQETPPLPINPGWIPETAQDDG